MRLRIVSPCPADFRAMREDGGRRFCEACQKHVYDLTCMREDEVRTLISQRGRICGRIAVAAAAIALAGCSAADQVTQPTVQVGPVASPPPKPDAGKIDDDETHMLGEIKISD
jgi:hypothetical protein